MASDEPSERLLFLCLLLLAQRQPNGVGVWQLFRNSVGVLTSFYLPWVMNLREPTLPLSQLPIFLFFSLYYSVEIKVP